MTFRRYFIVVMALAAILVVGSSVDSAYAGRDEKRDDADTVNDDNDSDDPALDDGKGLLSKASISFDDAKAAALKAVPGATSADEVDLEYVDGTLVFDVDVGGKTVRVDATSGAVLTVTDKDATDND